MTSGRLPQAGVRLVAADGKLVERELRKFGAEGEAALARIAKASKRTAPQIKAVDAAVSDARKRVDHFSDELGPLGAALKAVGPAGAAAAVGVGALTLGVTVAASRSREAAASIAEIGDAAARAGLDVQAFQELSYVAEQNRISVDALTDGMKELNLRADEFIQTGQGPAAESFQRLGLSADDLKDRLQNPSDLLVEIIGRLQELDRPARIRIADELFGGTAGERFVELVDRGADAVRDLIGEVNDLGLVYEKSVIDRAREIDKEFKNISKTVDQNLKRAFLDFAPIAMALSEALATSAKGFDTLIEKFRDLENKKTTTLQIRGAEITQELYDLNASLDRLEGRSDNRAKAQASRIRGQIGALVEEASRIQDIIDGRQRDSSPATPTTSSSPAVTSQDRTDALAYRQKILTLDEKRAQEISRINDLESKGLLKAMEAEAARTKANADYDAAVKSANAKAGATKKQSDLLREITKLIDTAKTPAAELEERLARIAELETSGTFKTAAGENAAQVAESARVKAMEEYLAAAEDTYAALERVQNIAESGTGADAFAAKIALAKREAKAFGQTMEQINTGIADGLTDAIFDAKNFGDAMLSLARQLSRDFLNSQLRGLFGRATSGSGIFGSILSSLFGGGGGTSAAVMTATAGIYHDGGKIGPGGPTRTVPAAVFNNAKRFHEGGYLRPNERPIIAENDELMLNRAMQKNTADSLTALASLAMRPAAMAPMQAASPAPVVNIFNGSNENVDTQSRTTANGAYEMDILVGQVDRELATRVSSGRSKTANAIGKRFALNRANSLTG